MGEKVVWRSVIFAGFAGTWVFGVAEEIIVLGLMFSLVLFGCEEKLAYTYSNPLVHTLIPS